MASMNINVTSVSTFNSAQAKKSLEEQEKIKATGLGEELVKLIFSGKGIPEKAKPAVNQP
jgi:hypothetical protein